MHHASSSAPLGQVTIGPSECSKSGPFCCSSSSYHFQPFLPRTNPLPVAIRGGHRYSRRYGIWRIWWTRLEEAFEIRSWCWSQTYVRRHFNSLTDSTVAFATARFHRTPRSPHTVDDAALPRNKRKLPYKSLRYISLDKSLSENSGRSEGKAA